jgi:hypothetical protein
MEKKTRIPTGKMKVSTFEKKYHVKLRSSNGRDINGRMRLKTHREQEGI